MANSSSRPTGSSKIPTMKQTKGEEFFEYIKSLGYIPSRQEKPAQFDYLFKDTETSNFMNSLMSNVKCTNILSDSELSQFRNLEANSTLLTGRALEESVAKAKKTESELEVSKDMDSLEEEKLRNLIEEKKTNIEKLEKLNGIISSANLLKEKEESKNKFETTKRSDLSKELDSNISMQRDQVNSLLETLSNKVELVLQKYHCPEENNGEDALWKLDWKNIIEDEDSLMELCQRFIEELGNNLVLECDSAQPVMFEEIRRVFQQYSKDIERLKHVIIYESVKQIELTACTTANTAVGLKLQDLLKSLDRMPPTYQREFLMETEAVNREIEAKIKVLKDQKLNEVRKALALHFTTDIRKLTNMKDFSNSKLTEMSSFVLNILTNQRARIFIVEQLLKAEGRKIEQFTIDLKCVGGHLKHFQEEQEALEGSPNVQSRFSTNDKAVADHLTKFGIPISVMSSYSTTLEKLAWIRDKYVDNPKAELAVSNQSDVKANIAYLNEKESVLSNFWKSFNEEQLGNSVQNDKIRQLEEIQDEMRKKLSAHAENKEKTTKDAIQRKMSILHEMKARISNARKEKNKRDEAKFDTNF